MNQHNRQVIRELALTFLLAAVLAAGCCLASVHRAHGAGVTPSCLEEQYALRSMGYVAVKADGTCGSVEVRATRHFQRVSGLDDDGIMGPITWAAVVGSAQAVRLTPPTNDAGLRGMPFAPDGLDPCAEMSWYAGQAGLPDSVAVNDGTGGFDDLPTREVAGVAEQAIGRRESGCNNSSANSCCGGWYGLAWSNLQAPGYRPFTSAHCSAFVRNDIVGASALSKQKQACVAMILYQWWLGHPGSAWPWRL